MRSLSEAFKKYLNISLTPLARFHNLGAHTVTNQSK